MGSTLDREDPLEWEMASYFSLLPWKIPWTEEPTVHGVVKSQTRLSTHTCTHIHYIYVYYIYIYIYIYFFFF